MARTAKTAPARPSWYECRVAKAGDSDGAWLHRLRNHYAIQNVTAMRPSLPFWVIHWCDDDSLDWMELGAPSRELKPFHFEIHFGREERRDQHYLEALAEATDAGAPTIRELSGWWDLFCPIHLEGAPRMFLHAGQFLRRQPSWDFLAARWRELTGQEPAGANPDFVRFTKMALSLPVLEDEAVEALQEFAQLYADTLGGSDEGSIHDRVDELNDGVLNRLWPIDDWVQLALSGEKFQLTPWNLEGGLTPWMKEGMGISRLPTVAMALMPVDPPTSSLDPTQLLIRNAELQRAVITFVRGFKETAATTLEDYGVSLITSTRRGRSKARARVELRERAQQLQDFVRERFALRCVVGIGSASPPGSRLDGSLREAVLALHMCVQLERDVLFHDEHEGSERFAYTALHRSGRALVDAFVEENPNAIKLAADRYVRLVLVYAKERVEIVRGQLLAMLFQILDAIQRRHPINDAARDEFAAQLVRELESAHALSHIIEAFKAALGRLSFVSSRVLEGPKLMRIEVILHHLRSNYAEQLRLPDVAKKAGMSVPAFSRAFKQATGASFLAYLREVRVEHAKRLLMTTPLIAEEIAHACGFQSQHHLIRSFKKVTGETPGAFRESMRRRSDDS